jgi:hypothetical protein
VRHEETTPSGLVIAYEDGLPDPEGKSKQRAYWIDGEKCPSVTTVLSCLDKPGLPYAAEKLTVEGMLQLDEPVRSVEVAIERLYSEGLRFFQAWQRKGTRGTEVHDALVDLIAGRDFKMPLDESTLFYIRALERWYEAESPETTQSEVMVASKVHQVAGRFDWLGVLPMVHWDALIRLDLKTVEKMPRYPNGNIRPPYPENLAQLAGYELCARESGYPASDYQAVLRVDKEGTTDLFVTVVDPDYFLAILGAYRGVAAVKGLSPVDPAEQLPVPPAITPNTRPWWVPEGSNYAANE